MWLKLGREELVNLEHCTSIKMGDEFVLELCYPDSTQNRSIHFQDEESRNLAFENIVKNFIRMQKAME